MTTASTNGTATTSNGTATTTEGAEPAWAKTLNENIGKLVEGVGQIKTLSEAANNRQQQDTTTDDDQTDDDSAADPLDDPQLDLQPMSVVARKILSQVEGVVQKALKPLQDQVGKANVTAETTRISQEVTDFANKTADFGAWGDEMSAVAKQYPNLGIADIYSLAKIRNPAKVEKLGADAKKAADDKAAADKKANPQRRTMSLAASGDTGEVINEKMSPGDAAKAAWDDTVAKFGGSPFA